MGQITRTNFGLTHKAFVSNAEILNFTVPVTLIDAIPGVVIVPMFVFYRLKWAADYGGIDPLAELDILYAGNGQIMSSLKESNATISALLAGGANANAFSSQMSNVSGTVAGIGQALFDDGYCVNRAIVCTLFNNGNPITGGNDLNVLEVTIFYSTVPVS